MRTPEGTIETRCERCNETVYVTLEEEAKGEPIYCSDHHQELDECANMDRDYFAMLDSMDCEMDWSS